MRTKLSYCIVFHRIFISNRNEKMQILMKKPVYLGLSILELSKILMYEFWYDYVKLKFKSRDALNYELDRPMPIGKNKKSNWINEK